jgi:predicted Zn-dependent peptidase
MKKLIFIFSLFFLACSLFCQDNPLKVETYQLSNGLTVYLNEDHNMPMVHGMVAVKGGAKRDPKDATGIAHYFEHIMFKGTDEIGTISYVQEMPYLDSIENLYDRLWDETSEEERTMIQKEINRISLKAADYAIPNEFDKIVSAMGGTGLNAGTGQEMIVYYNSFPANQVAKWIELYSHRFINPVYRLFQSELETVYEEKNMSLDDPMERMFETYMKRFYKNTPYGQQTVLGSVEHLKKPSLSKMEEYFNAYYVARNMALVLSGDFDSESVRPLIEEKFGRWRSGEVPPPLELKEEPFSGRELVSTRMTPIKIGIMGFRTVPRNHEDEMELEVISNLLTNQASTGLIDELVNDNKIMLAMAFSDLKTELGGYMIAFVPKVVGQSLESAEKLVMGQMQKLREGDFSDNLLRGVKTGLKKQYERNLEDMRWRTYAIMDAFIYGVSWEKYLSAPEEIEKITRDDVIAIANKYFGDNYLVFYSKTGFPKKTKLDKPPFEPVVAKNADKQSAYARMIEEMPVTFMEPRFIDFEKDVIRTDLSEGINTYVTPNPINHIFSIRIKYGKGSYNDPVADQATSIFQYAHPEGQSYMEFKSELQLLGCDIYAFNDLSSTTVDIDGLEENLEPSLKLVNKLLTAYSVDEKQLEKLVQDIKFNKNFEKKDLWTKNDALGQYALYGRQSEYLSRLSEDEIKKLSAEDLVDKFREITGYQYEVHYCGTRNDGEFNRLFRENMTLSGELTASPGKIELEREDYEGNTIIILDDKKAIQSHINLYVEGSVNDEESRTGMAGFNDYIGGTMASILFQEIREYRSLAYGVQGGYRASFYFDRPGYFAGFLSTQSDKTMEALQAYRDILTDLPEKPERMEAIRNDLTLSINASQPRFRNKSASVSEWLQQGYREDPRKLRYRKYENMEFPEILGFYKDNLKGKPWLVSVVGDTKRIKMEKLTDYGKVKTVTFSDIYKW